MNSSYNYPKYFPQSKFHWFIIGLQYSLGPHSIIPRESGVKNGVRGGSGSVVGYGTPSFGTHQLYLVLQDLKKNCE